MYLLYLFYLILLFMEIQKRQSINLYNDILPLAKCNSDTHIFLLTCHLYIITNIFLQSIIVFCTFLCLHNINPRTPEYRNTYKKTFFVTYW